MTGVWSDAGSEVLVIIDIPSKSHTLIDPMAMIGEGCSDACSDVCSITCSLSSGTAKLIFFVVVVVVSDSLTLQTS